MRLVLASILSVLWSTAHAGEIIVDVASIHTKPTYEFTTTTTYIDRDTGKVLKTESTSEFRRYNNFNPGVGYRTDGGWMFGSYRNSYNQRTSYAGKEFMFTDNFGAILALGTGYKEETGRTLQPIAGLEYKVRLGGGYTANFVASPPLFRPNTAGFLHLAISKSI